MNIETIKTRVQFEQILKDFAPVLYGQHNLPNLLCHEAIDKNFDQGFVLYANNETKATACVIKNPDLFFKNEKAVCIAFYECVEDIRIAEKLLHSAVDYCKEQGYKYLICPMNGSTWNAYRFAVEPITDSYISEPFHKSYYANQFENFGFEILAEYITQIDTTLHLPDAPKILNKEITFRTLDKNNYETEMKTIFAFCKDIFYNNFLYTEISENAFLEKYMALKNIINPNFVIIAEDKGEVVGLILALHDHYCQHSKRIIVKTLARKRGERYAGVAHELSRRITMLALQLNYQSILHAFMHQANASTNISRLFSGEPFRKYKLYYTAV